MDGPAILAASMSVPHERGPTKALWQYHSRSDLHSKVACWVVLYDLLQQSALMRQHAADGKIVFGVNHKLTDFQWQKHKVLDLVIARPDGPIEPMTLSDLATQYHVVLAPPQEASLAALPALHQAPVGAVLVALEAKAAMTAHVKALPRLFDELNSSHSIVHGASSKALAVGLAMVNSSPTFVSPDRNKTPGAAVTVTHHRQPADARATVEMIRNNIPRRSGASSVGYDGLAIVVVSAANDGSPVTLVTDPPAPPPGDSFNYDNMNTRVANEYDATFKSI